MNQMYPDLLLLIGAKGSGKSFIGQLLEQALGIPFLRAEPIWKALKEDASIGPDEYVARGIDAIVAAASDLARRSAVFTLETTGAFEDMPGFIDLFRPFSRPRLIYIKARPETCLQRVHTRDRSAHIDVSDVLVQRVNARSFALQLPYEAVIDNDPFASAEEVLRIIRPLANIATSAHSGHDSR